mmetsp:Transcript_117001/g.164430  ORF Transcript_117001/g.164430 Transcript_117001/m.164430 type:complete len:245 (+) Transcript_117001:132-866(+)
MCHWPGAGAMPYPATLGTFRARGPKEPTWASALLQPTSMASAACEANHRKRRLQTLENVEILTATSQVIAARSERRPLAPEAGSAMLRPGTGQAASAVPGYSGHVPGKLSENIVGATCAAANALAASAAPGTITWQRTDAPGVSARSRAGAAEGRAVPGYTGYVHGKRPEPDVMGMPGPFRAANEHADKVRVKARARAQEADCTEAAKMTASKQAAARSTKASSITNSPRSSETRATRTSRTSQ